jgi:hypothetical protein
MKRIILSLTMLLVSIASFAQSEKYQKGMATAKTAFDSAKTVEEMQTAAGIFERIADAEKTQWLPYYYAALANTNIGWMDQKSDKDKLAEKTKSLLDKAEALNKNSEIYVVRSMAATQQMLVDPQGRWQSYGAESQEALQTAKSLDVNNPRVYFLEGQALLNTPAAFGGGKDKAKPVLQKSVDLFNSFKPATDLHPTWGQKMAEGALAGASK